MLKYGVFKLIVPKKNLEVPFLHPTAGSKMVHWGGRFFYPWGSNPQPPSPHVWIQIRMDIVQIIFSDYQKQITFEHQNHIFFLKKTALSQFF